MMNQNVLVERPIWMYGKEERASRPFNVERDRELMKQIASFVQNKIMS